MSQWKNSESRIKNFSTLWCCIRIRLKTLLFGINKNKELFRKEFKKLITKFVEGKKMFLKTIQEREKSKH